ncbi:nucleoside-diphosphate sugar epimerase/dehydratase [Devosia ginsengisoli]|uniref:nucleoside-diphosphate sugar epimerase/dehydratase n=1 Tax=Devosia ginsengisoli TaxID=400770 RepID=UPI0026E94C38|nr:nucleoside-diphosphate sugar epimerase/dehydratase [Devosia ginsengisoli]MCR6672063.1 polysaccharide biosynthesis protein [Devosia ginsengisoli]
MLRSISKLLNKVPRSLKRLILLVFDFVVLLFSAWAAYALRLNRIYTPDFLHLLTLLAAPVVAIPIFVRLGLYRSVIRYLPDRALWTTAKAAVLATLCWICVLFAFELLRLSTVPRSVPLIYCALAILFVGGSRFTAKYLLWSPMRRKYAGQVAIYGAGAAGAQLATALRRDGSLYVAGFLDDDRAMHGRDVAGIRVHSPAQIGRLLQTTGVTEVILSMPSISAQRRQQIVADLAQHQLKIRAVPAISDIASGRYLISQIREIDIDDILGRSAVPADPELLQQILEERVILVSGAGGSIGSELCRLIAKWRPRKLVLLEANEFALYQIERALRSNLQIVPVLGSVGDRALVRRTLKAHGVQVVFHAAAHKHVPLVEANALEGIRNNVFGTNVIATESFDAGVENFVLISTDKAVRPPNVMGATKRWAELIVGYYANRARIEDTRQKFCTVRFGNVLGSNGSVVPLFKEQIASGGPVTVTDNEMTRYFMSIHEAAELIVQAATMSEGGDTFLLEMGDPVRIRDLAENMIHLAGLTIRDANNPDGDIAITVTGRRSGEKTHEELFYDPASVERTRQPMILKAAPTVWPFDSLDQKIMRLERALLDEDEPVARRILFDLVNAKNSTNAAVDDKSMT